MGEEDLLQAVLDCLDEGEAWEEPLPDRLLDTTVWWIGLWVLYGEEVAKFHFAHRPTQAEIDLALKKILGWVDHPEVEIEVAPIVECRLSDLIKN